MKDTDMNGLAVHEQNTTSAAQEDDEIQYAVQCGIRPFKEVLAALFRHWEAQGILPKGATEEAIDKLFDKLNSDDTTWNEALREEIAGEAESFLLEFHEWLSSRDGRARLEKLAAAESSPDVPSAGMSPGATASVG